MIAFSYYSLCSCMRECDCLVSHLHFDLLFSSEYCMTTAVLKPTVQFNQTFNNFTVPSVCMCIAFFFFNNQWLLLYLETNTQAYYWSFARFRSLFAVFQHKCQHQFSTIETISCLFLFYQLSCKTQMQVRCLFSFIVFRIIKFAVY